MYFAVFNRIFLRSVCARLKRDGGMACVYTFGDSLTAISDDGIRTLKIVEIWNSRYMRNKLHLWVFGCHCDRGN